jgi:hypothetical protein
VKHWDGETVRRDVLEAVPALDAAMAAGRRERIPEVRGDPDDAVARLVEIDVERAAQRTLRARGFLDDRDVEVRLPLDAFFHEGPDGTDLRAQAAIGAVRVVDRLEELRR